jgi:hypothetical protein
MGNQCGCGENEDPVVVAKRMQGLIKIQSVYRSYQARKRKMSIKEEKLQELFSMYNFILTLIWLSL